MNERQHPPQDWSWMAGDARPTPDQEIASLREEVRRLNDDVKFLRQLLEQVKGELAVRRQQR